MTCLTCLMFPNVVKDAECEALIAAAERQGFEASGNCIQVPSK